MIRTVQYFLNRENDKFKESIYKDNFCYKISGLMCKTEEELYEHFIRELDFPDYCGRTWDSINDCITDFEWLSTKKVTIFFNDINHILEDEPEKKKIIFRIILKSIESFTEENIDEEPEEHVALNLVFNTTPENEKFVQDLFKQYEIKESNIKEL